MEIFRQASYNGNLTLPTLDEISKKNAKGTNYISDFNFWLVTRKHRLADGKD